jgi:hypothetical protein
MRATDHKSNPLARVLLNYFVRGRQQRFQDGEAERLGGLGRCEAFGFANPRRVGLHCRGPEWAMVV